MEKFEIVYKCTECGYEISKLYREPSQYGEWRSGVDIQQSNTDDENHILKNPCPKCGKGEMKRKK
jgi:ribosomal protein L37AE/L43A